MASSSPFSVESGSRDAIEQVCLQFDSAWSDGQRPDLANYLVHLPLELRRDALCALLWIEWEHLRERGTPPQLDEYRQRFAELSEAVDEAWRSDFRRFAREAESPQSRGGRYVIIRHHASGGLGQVYLAHDEELDRPVALKEIQHRHAGSPATQERFVREARITGKLEHPGIVPVYSVGTQENGTPYYTMRFVHGESLKNAIDAFHGQRPPLSFQSRPFRQLLARFAYVCNVIEFAHSRGVVHRDLKPANIMVGKHGETLVVDWGLAKEIGQPESIDPLISPGPSLTNLSFTTHGALIGTPSYMSPEQASGDGANLTAASDIYSLGATLYQVLTGSPPLRGAPQDTMLLRIQRGEIPPVTELRPDIPPPLTAICRTAMSLDPDDRYPTAAALADDLEHWLADEPVSACADRFPARAARWARRHSTLVASSLIALLVLAASLATIASLIAVNNHELAKARAATEAKRLDAVAAQLTADHHRLTAETERDYAKSLAEFMTERFQSPDPNVDNSTVTVAEFLDQSFEELKSNNRVESTAKTGLLTSIVRSNIGLGRFAKAIVVAEYGFDLAQRHLVATSEHYLNAKGALAEAYLENGSSAIAVTLLEEIATASHHTESPDNLAAVRREYYLADALRRAGRTRDSEELANRLLAQWRPVLGSEHLQVLELEHVIACVSLTRGDFTSAIPVFEKLIAYFDRADLTDTPQATIARNNLATALEMSGRYDDAIRIHNQNIQRRLALLGPSHPSTLNTQNNLAQVYLRAGQFKAAIRLYESTLHTRESLYPKDVGNIAITMSGLATAHLQSGFTDDAINIFRKAAALTSASLSIDHGVALRSQFDLALALVQNGFVEEAKPLLQRYIELHEEKLGTGHVALLEAKERLALCFRMLGKNSEAILIYEELQPRLRETLGIDHPRTLAVQSGLATVLASSGSFERASEIYRDTLARSQRILGPEHPATLQTQVNLGVLYEQNNRPELAVPLLNVTRGLVVSRLGWEHPMATQVHIALASAYVAQNRTTDAAAIYGTLLHELELRLGDTHTTTITARRYVAGFLFSAGDTGRAIEILKISYDVLREKLGIENLQTRECMQELAIALRDTGHNSEAEPLWREIVGFDVSGDTVTHAANLYWLALCQLRQKKYAESEDAFSKCCSIREQSVPGDWTCAIAQLALGHALAGQGKFEIAEVHALAAIKKLQDVRDTIPDGSHSRIVREAINHLVQLYRLWGREDEVRYWTNQLGEGLDSNRP